MSPGAEPCAFAKSTLSFTLKDVLFDGAAGADVDLKSTFASDIGTVVALPEICAIRDRAADLLFRKGILARVQIPQQTLKDGVLTLSVTMATVAEVHIEGDAGPARAKVAAYFNRLRDMKPFDLRKAQRYLLLASEMPGVQIRARLKASDSGKEGAVDFDVVVAWHPIGLAVIAQNTGPESLGRESGVVRFDLNSLTPWGDRSSLVAYGSLDGHTQSVWQLIEEMRPGSDGLVLRASFARGISRPAGVLAPLKLRGTSSVTRLEAEYPLLHRRDSDLHLDGGFEIADQGLLFANQNLSHDKARVLFTSLHGHRDIAFDHDGLSLGGGLELRRGVAGLGASKPRSPLLSRSDADPQATVVRFDARTTLTTPGGGYVDLNAQAQRAWEPLLSYEAFTVGNLTIGRGYDPSVLQGDNGWGVAAEAGHTLRTARGHAFQLYGFYDIARAESLSPGGLKRTLRSDGLGARLFLPRNLRLDLAYAHPLDKSYPGTSNNVSGDRWLITLSAAY